jgi:hypothetical protein
MLLTLHQMRGETRERDRGGDAMPQGKSTADRFNFPSPVSLPSSPEDEEEKEEEEMEEDQEEQTEASTKRKRT